MERSDISLYYDYLVSRQVAVGEIRFWLANTDHKKLLQAICRHWKKEGEVVSYYGKSQILSVGIT